MAEEGNTKAAERVQCFGRKKTAVAVALVRTGSGQVRVNGCPIHTVKPDVLRVKVYEPLLLLGDKFKKVDIRLRVKGGGYTSQVYPCGKRLRRVSSHTTRNTSTRPRRKRSRTS